MRYLPRALACVCAIVPIAALALVVGSTIVGALPAIAQLGPALMAPTGTSPYSMQAPLWGTLLLAAQALLFGLPVSLAIAIVMREFEIPLISRGLGGVVGGTGRYSPDRLRDLHLVRGAVVHVAQVRGCATE